MLKTRSLGAASILVALLGGPMSAQPPTVTVNDYLKEVRIFPPGSSDFAKAASSLGVDASLATLGAGASLVVAIRNDSGEVIDSMRLLFQVDNDKEGVHAPRLTLQQGPLAPGQAMLAAPHELAGAVTALIRHGGPGIGGGPARPLDFYQGATVTASIDSATLASGRFVGADTVNFFTPLIEEQTAKKSFFADLAAQSKTLTDSELQQVLAARQSAADAAKGKATSLANFNLATMTEFSLSIQALARLTHSGLQDLTSWAEQENMKLSSQPTLHR